ncbi:MAG: hypothetical protein ABW128_17200 [Rhizorhabdus sp.]
MRAKKQRDWAKEAAVARSDLNTLYGVIAILEGGTVSAACYGATQRIIRTCKTESGKCLTRYDRALAQIGEYDA